MISTAESRGPHSAGSSATEGAGSGAPFEFSGGTVGGGGGGSYSDDGEGDDEEGEDEGDVRRHQILEAALKHVVGYKT